jgi:antitoxin (DNA-binding transcriptional repressor) of toxin-antitoxin stability system
MRVVGVKLLKAKLSEYLRDVRRGESFLVTDRDQVIAELRPPGSSSAVTGDVLQQSLDELAKNGAISAARRTTEGWAWRPKGAGLPAGSAASLLDSLREERGT